MAGTVIIGAQFGDEGKGKITDYLAEKADLVVRYNGGNNAGHTVVVGKRVIKLHLIPSGVAHGKRIAIGAGVIIDPKVIMEEIKNLEKFAKVDLVIDARAHVIMPWHILLDGAAEEKKETVTIGTTRKGIGPCYAEKCERTGIRMEDLASEKRLKEKLDKIFDIRKGILEKVYGMKVGFTEESVLEEYGGLGKKMKGLVGDVSMEVNEALEAGKNVLFEGANGVFLDNDFGTYPFVTSSHPLAGGVTTGVGVGCAAVDRVIGIAKAYTTRVGEGPFPTELKGEMGDRIREIGREYGTTTGRPRRVGWLDLVLLRSAARLNGLTEFAVTKLDVLSGIEKLKICVSYGCEGREHKYVPALTGEFETCKPKYVEVDGFEITGNEKIYSDLPKAAQDYIELIEKETNVPAKMISIGPERNQTIRR